MASPGCCAPADRQFTPARAQSELRRYRRRGPTGTARRILRMLSESRVQAETLLDVGAGIGVLHPALDRVICCWPVVPPLRRSGFKP